MVIVIMQVNGKTYFHEGKSTDECAAVVKLWLEFTKKKYPHGSFTPRYFYAAEVVYKAAS